MKSPTSAFRQSVEALSLMAKLGANIEGFMKQKKKKTKWLPPTKYYPEIEKVIYNKPATVVLLKTGEKGIAKLQKGDKWNPELGFWVAYAKALRLKAYPKIQVVGSVDFGIDSIHIALVNSDGTLDWKTGGKAIECKKVNFSNLTAHVGER